MDNQVATNAAIAAGETTHDVNFVFCTSHRDALRPDLGDRRFWTLNFKAKNPGERFWDMFPDGDNLRITVTGDQGSGKTLIINMIKRALEVTGVRARVADSKSGHETILLEPIKYDNSVAEAVDAAKGPVVAWIIERSGVPPTICHYADVAAEMAKRPGHVVTPYYSKVKA